MQPSTTLVDALSISPYATLAHLHTVSALTATSLPISLQNISITFRATRVQALSLLLRHVLPLILLPSAVSTYGSEQLSNSVASLLQAVRANANLPSILPVPPLPNYIHPDLVHLADPAFEDASTSLAQAASTDVDELTEIWNRLIPAQASPGPDQLLNHIQCAKATSSRARASARRMDQLIANTRIVALATLHNTLRNALTALEADTVELTEEHSAEKVHVMLLYARGRAVAAKLKLLRAEIAAAMYTPECAKALRVIAGEIKSKVGGVEALLVDKRLRLQQNHALGAEYLRVVRELAKAERLLEHKLWTRRELDIE